MQGEERATLIELVARALDALEKGGHEALEALLAAYPREAEAVRRRLAVLADSGLQEAPSALGDVPRELGDFRLVEQIGGGGMGVVWRAEERSLGREVALKLVRPDQLFFPGARERFRREVEIVARLHHPGVVPVYGVGEASGLPYYAMELVHGASLADVLERLQGRDPTTLEGRAFLEALPPGPDEGEGGPLFHGSWHDVVLRIVRDVAETLEHVRRRGVLHRDVKPSNVMVTRGGRVLLLDFGLSTREGDARLTRAGSAVGSLAYMAPERMRDADEASGVDGPETDDTRQDVYSLGVTTYELLALTPPYGGSDPLVLARAARQGDHPPLRERNRAVPADAATVVAVAMERDPERRYATPGDLARDLTNALERRPLEARPPGPLVRARRWVQRNPIVATLVAAAVIVPSLLFVQEARNRAVVEGKNEAIAAQSVRLEETNEELALALEAAREERGRAVAALEKAMDAVDSMMVRVGDEALVDVPGMENVRRELLREALDFQEWFLAHADGVEGLGPRAARVALGAARVHGWLGEMGEACDALERAERMLAEGAPGDAPDEALHAEILATRAHAERLRGDFAAADRAVAEALELLDREESASAALAALRCRLLVDRAQALRSTGDLPAAERALVDALDALPVLRDDATGTAAERTSLRLEEVRACTMLADILDARMQIGSTLAGGGVAEREFDPELLTRVAAVSERAAEVALGLLAEGSASAVARHRAGRALLAAALQSFHLGDPLRSAERYERAIELFEGLVADHPGVASYRADLAGALSNFAGLLYQTGEPERGFTTMERSVEQYGAYFGAGGDDLDMRFAYTSTLYNLGAFHVTADDPELALGFYSRALEALDAALQDAPGHAQGRWFETVFLDQALPTFALLDRRTELVRHLRGYLDRANGPRGRLDVLAALASWPAAAASNPGLDPALVETLVRVVDEAAAELLRSQLAADRLRPDDVVGDGRLAPLVAWPGTQAVLEGR